MTAAAFPDCAATGCAAPATCWYDGRWLCSAHHQSARQRKLAETLRPVRVPRAALELDELDESRRGAVSAPENSGSAGDHGGGCGCFMVLAGIALVIYAVTWAQEYPADRAHQRDLEQRRCLEAGR